MVDRAVVAQGLHFITLNRLPRAGLAARLLSLWNRTRPDQPQDWPYAPYSLARFDREFLEPGELALERSSALISALLPPLPGRGVNLLSVPCHLLLLHQISGNTANQCQRLRRPDLPLLLCFGNIRTQDVTDQVRGTGQA